MRGKVAPRSDGCPDPGPRVARIGTNGPTCPVRLTAVPDPITIPWRGTDHGGTMARQIDAVTAQARAEGMAETTIDGLVSTASILGPDLVALTRERLVEILVARGYKTSSLRVTLSKVRTIYRLLAAAGFAVVDPTLGIKRPRTPKPAPKPMTDEQVRILLDGLRRPYRDWLILATMAGLRCGEIAVLRGDCLQEWPSGWKLRLPGKGGTIRTIPAHPSVVEVIQAYDTGGRLWPFLTARQVSARFAAAAQRAGVPVTLHQGRHYFCSTLYRATHDLMLVRDVARHESINSTMGYVRLDDDRAVAAIADLSLPA